MSQQGLRQASVRAVTGTAFTYEGDWHALFDQASIPVGTFNGRLLAWINYKLSANYTNLPEAQQALATANGAYDFASMGTFDAGSASGPAWLLGLELMSDFNVTSAQSIDGSTRTEANGIYLRVHYDTGIIGTLTSWDASKVTMPNAADPGFDPDGTPNPAVPRRLVITGIGRPYKPYPESDDAGDAKYTDADAGAGYIDIAMSQRLFKTTLTDTTGRSYFTDTGPVVFAAGFLNGSSEAGSAPSSMVTRSDSLDYWPSIWKHLLEIYPHVSANGSLDIEWTAGALLAQQGAPVACLEAWTWDGANAGTVVRASAMEENSATVGLSAPSGYTFDSFKTTLSFAGLPHGAVGVRSRVKPWAGPAIESVDAGDDFTATYTQNLLKTFPVYHDLNGDRTDIYTKVDPVGGRSSANKAGVFTTKAAALADQGFTSISLGAASGVLYNSDSALRGSGNTHADTDGLHVVLPSSASSPSTDAGSYCIDVQITAATGYLPLIIESESGTASNNGVMRGVTRAGGSITLATKTLGANTKKVKFKGLILANEGTTGDDRTVVYVGGAPTTTPTGANAAYMSYEDCEILGEVAGASRFPVDGTNALYLKRTLIHNNRFRTGWTGFAGAIHQIGCKFTGDTNCDGTCLLGCWMTDGEVTGANFDVGNQCAFNQGSSPRGAPNIPPTRQFFIHNTRLDTWNKGGLGACTDPIGRPPDIQLRYWAGLILGGRYANLNNTLIDFSDDLITSGTERNVIKGMTIAGMPSEGVNGVGFMRINGWYNDNGWIGANKTGSIQFSYIPALPMKNSWFNGNAAFVSTGANPALAWSVSNNYYPAEPAYDPTGGLTPQTGAFTVQARQYKPPPSIGVLGDRIDVIPAGTLLTNADYWYSIGGSNVTGRQANRNRNIAMRMGVDSYCVLRSDTYYPSEPLDVSPTGTMADFDWPGTFEISTGVSSFGDVVTSSLYVSDTTGDGADPTVQNFRPADDSPLIGLRPPELRWDLRDPLGQVRPTDSYGAACALEIIPDPTPDAFTFNAVTGADLSTVYTSTPPTAITGINVDTTINVVGGEYDINSSGSFTSASGTFPVGGTVRARLLSSSSNSTPVSCDVTIGGVTGTYTVTTASAGSPPSIVVDPAISGLNAGGTADIGQVATCSTGTWNGSPSSYTYQWQRYAGSWADISGQTANTYTPTVADTQTGTKLRCVVTATNGNGSTPANSNEPDVFHPYQIAIAYWDLEDTTKVTVAGGKVTSWTSGGTATTPITAAEVSGSGVTYGATAINSSRPGITGNLTSMYLEALSSGSGGSQDLTSLPTGSTAVEFFASSSNADAAINTRGFFGYSAASTSNVREKSMSKANVSGVGGLQCSAGTGGSNINSTNGPLTGRQVVHAIYISNSVDARLNGVSGSTPTATTLNGLAARLRIMASPVNVSTNPASYGSLTLNGIGIFPALTSGQRNSATYWHNARLGL